VTPSTGTHPIRVCLIGVTGFAHTHYTELTGHHALGLVRLVAATVINPAEVPDKVRHLGELGCRVHRDFREMLAAWAGRADLCIVPTGIHWHAPMAIAALEAGMDVLLEKPAAATLDDIRAMQAAERGSGRRVMLGFQSMYASETLAMKRMVLDGTLGRIGEILSWSLWPRDASYYARNAWAGRLSVAGAPVLDSPFNNAVAHQLHMILFLAGSSETSSAAVTGVRAELHRAKPIESCDTAALAISTASGIPCRFLTSHACDTTIDPVIEIRGERGTLRWESHRRLTLRRGDGPAEPLPMDDPAQCRQRMHAAVREAIGGGGAFLSRLDHAAEHTRVVNLAHAAGPIRTIPAEHQSAAGIIRGLPEVMAATAAAPGTLFSDHRPPWGAAPACRDAAPDPTVAEMVGAAP
jgi:predicted dehydrogenase